MPGRGIVLTTDEIYHVFNKGIDSRTTFTTLREYSRAELTISFYRFIAPPMRLSYYLGKSKEEKANIFDKFKKDNEKLIDIYCYCLMPNHYHFLLRQKVDSGIAKFMSQIQNSYTRYFNTRHKRIGALFLEQFKAKRIENDEQLLHVSRYIHLNPYTAHLLEKIKDLENYPWSSFKEYANPGSDNICDTDNILSYFKTKNDYKDFVYNRAEYQRELDEIKHLMFEE